MTVSAEKIPVRRLRGRVFGNSRSGSERQRGDDTKRKGTEASAGLHLSPYFVAA
jgi:hypothetical protein